MTARTTRFLLSVIASCAAFAAATTSLAQPRQHLVPAPPIAVWRPPVLQVQGAEQPIRLRALKVDVEVSAGVAETRVQMEFFNPNARVLEGKLQFPLASGQIVSGFALDVDGEMRDAVPVEKARAQQVFEDITRRRVDPGLLETTLGNNYELRIYPLAPGKTRTVVLRLIEPAATRLSLPLAYTKTVDHLEVSLRYASASARPQIVSGNPLSLVFERDPRGGFIARRALERTVLPNEALVVQAATPNAIEITTEQRDGDTFFTLDLAVSPRSVLRPLPRQVQIVWDASGSGAGRQFDRELALLDAYFKRAGTIAVTLTRFADVALPNERFMVKNGDWSALRRALQSTVYDGASQLAAVRHDGASQEAIWFSDGLANYGVPWRRTFPVPAYMVHSSTSGDPAALRAVAEASGGRSIDLTVLTQSQAADALLARGTQLLDIGALGAKDLVVDSHHATGGRLVLAGILTAGSAELTLRLRGSDGAVTTRVVRIDDQRNASRLASLQWARLTLASLEGDPNVNKNRIREIGRRFSIATRETSLLVLELVDDYVRNEIEPPASLRAAYDKLASTMKRNRAQSDAARLAQVVRRFEARVAWWNRKFPKDEPAKVLQIAKSQAGALGEPQQSMRQQPRSEMARDAASPSPMAAPPMVAGRLAAAPAERERKDDGRASGSPSISIALKPATSSAWTKRLNASDPESWYAIYLDERLGSATSVGFFLDSAEFFLQKGQHELGLRALSNLAEMDLQNRQVLRLLAYRLQQAGEIALAVPIFERVLELAPNEPQSHRDLGLALAQSGQAQRAVDRLYEVVTGAWDGRFADIDLITLTELNAVVADAERAGKPVDVSAIEPRLLKHLPLDVRVVLAWDADATDVDLHVIDPNGEEVFYGRNLSYQGGAITRDATGGYGPEEFALRNAKPGKYRVEANFFGHRQQVLTSSTGLMLWLSSGFGTPAQQDQRTTLRVKSEGGQRVVVGEFEVKRCGAALALTRRRCDGHTCR
ncbi:MAG: VIT domain-containing protein, partial [Burkholderiaceae bacterium]